MRIPTYQQQVPYRGAYARDVRLAQRSMESSGNKLWTDLASAGGVLSGIYETPMMLNRTGDAYEEAKDNWNAAWDELKMRRDFGNRYVYDAKQKAKQPKPPKKSASKEGIALLGFSSPKREELLRFGREKAFGQTPAGAQADPVSKLDEYFGQNAAGNILPSAPQEREDLLSQDYAVLRREVQELSLKRDAQARKEQFERGAGHFVQTAGMVRAPRALEQYIRANLDAAGEEARSGGLDAAQWKGRREALQTQAVRHNIEAALAAGETKQAEAVYGHFEHKLDEKDKTLLKSKILLHKADLESEKLFPLAVKECVDENGSVDEKKLNSFVRSRCEGREEELKNETGAGLRARLETHRRKELLRRADAYERLLAKGAQEGLGALEGAYSRGDKEFKRDARILRALQTRPEKNSDPAAFNRLFTLAAREKDGAREIETAFDEGHISAADYLRLKSRVCAAGAARLDPRERLLERAAERLCRSCGLEGGEAEDVKYFIFTSGPGAQERLEAARTARQILNLQEKNK